MQIMTGIEVNSEANFPKLREYCPSAEGTGNIPATEGSLHGLIEFIYCIKCYLAIKSANELY